MIKRFVIIVCDIALFLTVFRNLTPWCFNQIGKMYLDKENYPKAADCFKGALIFKNGNKEYRYNYVKTLSELSPDIDIQKEMFRISNDDNKDSAQQLATQVIEKWRLNIFKNIGENYIDQAIFHDGIIRWDQNKFPIKVFITNESGKNLPDYYVFQINKAVSLWQSSTNFIKFESVSKQKDANIIIKITNLPENICNGNNCTYTVGYTVPNYRGNILHNMTITLYTSDPLGKYFTDKEIFNTALHEIGHALGIMGHSYNQNDLMYMSNEGNAQYIQYRSSFQYLSSKDINTIKLLYKLEPNITNSDRYNKKGLIYAPIVLGSSKEIKLRKLKEAQNYVKKAPDISNGYIDLGIAYMQLEKPKEAINSFQKAYRLSKSSQERYISAFNLALIYFEMQKYNDAKSAAELAKNESDSAEINKLISEINIRIK